MRLSLKEYQADTLDRLEEYAAAFREAEEAGARRPERDAFERQTGRDYLGVPGFDRVPYVCARIPTGGGKTLVAGHAVGRVWRAVRGDCAPCVLWVTPGTTVRDQTLKGLRTPHHPLRLAVADGFGRDPEVMTLEDALTRPNALRPSCPAVLVCTIQSYRIRSAVGADPDADVLRRVYRDDGYLMERFRDLPAYAAGDYLDRDEETGLTRLSLANVLRLRKPLVVMDEAHDARTPTSFESLARFGPCFVLELTATPQQTHDPDAADPTFASNVLHAVSALALKREGMIKLPVELESRERWEDVLAAVVHRRQELEDIVDAAHAEVGLPYLRPVALIQAQNKSRSKETHDVAGVAEQLLKFDGVTADQVVRHGQEFSELDEVPDIMREDSPVRFVVTNQKLAQGWDCPLAWVLGSIGSVATATAVEQLLGRILRMPNANPTGIPALDRAYAVVLSRDVMETAAALRGGMVEQLGFDERGAADALRVRRERGASALPFTRIALSAPPDAAKLSSDVIARTKYAADAADGGGALTFTRVPTAADLKAVRAAVAEEDRPAVDAAWESVRPVGSAPKPLDEQAAPVRVPQLVVTQGGHASLFDPIELETFEWDLAGYEAAPDDRAFPDEVDMGGSAVLDVDGPDDAHGRLTLAAAGRVRLRQLDLIDDSAAWTETDLVRWLDRDLHRGGRFDTLTMAESQPWLLRAVTGLIEGRGFDRETVARRREELARVLRARLADRERQQVKAAADELFALDPNALRTDPDRAFALEEPDYTPADEYRGGVRFYKHAFTFVGDLNGEEARCAAEIDGHENVVRWVRNPEHAAHGGFSLPLAPGRFFPDFLAETADGAVVLIEYKSADRAAIPAEQFKRQIGELWADRGGHRCRFAWVVERDWRELDRVLSGE